MAWGMFFAIPCPALKWDEKEYPKMLLCLPLIGLIIGAIWSIIALLVMKLGGLGLFGPAILSLIPALLTGFMHLDGYMDCSDAVLSRRDLETKRKILKDSHVGAFAVIALVIWALLNFAAFASVTLDSRILCLIFIPAAVRCCSAFAVLSFQPMNTSSYAKIPETVKPYHKFIALIMLAIFVIIPIIICGFPGISCLIGAAAGMLTILYIRKELQGMSGDISGAAIVIGEFVAAATLAVL